MSDEKIDIILTTDRTMMSNHHGKEFLGFMATGPPIGMLEFLDVALVDDYSLYRYLML